MTAIRKPQTFDVSLPFELLDLLIEPDVKVYLLEKIMTAGQHVTRSRDLLHSSSRSEVEVGQAVHGEVGELDICGVRGYVLVAEGEIGLEDVLARV